MDPSASVPWAAAVALPIDWPEEDAGAAALSRCGPLFRRSVLVVAPELPGGRSVLRRARAEGAMVTALCPKERAADAREAGADTVLDPLRQDPTWYRGAWSVIYDPARRIGFARASASLVPGGVYVTSAPRLADRARALLFHLSGGPRLLSMGGWRAPLSGAR